jgi:hypothetical protein
MTQFSPRTVWRAGFILGLVNFAVWSFSGANASEETCRKTVGDKQAERLAWECLQVEPSIHAPCNADARCSDIVGSIKFGCSILNEPHQSNLTEREKRLMRPPKFCAKYLAGP